MIRTPRLTVEDVMVLASMRKVQGFEVQHIFRYVKQAPFTNKPLLESFCATRRPDESQPGWERCLNASLLSFCFLLRRTNKRC
jgi:hypothetical protein